MNQQRQLENLRKITAVKYEAEQAALQKLLMEENNIRTELTRLKDMMQSARAESLAPSEMRAIGADVLWQGWIGRNVAALNIKLAAVLAKKEQRLKKVRKAFGKANVVAQLISETSRQSKQANAQTQVDAALDQFMHR